MEATDQDTGSLGNIEYTIVSVSNNGGNKFEIDDKGEIFVKGKVGRDEIYTIVVEARDNPRGQLQR